MIGNRELRWIVALEAALFFSVPSWVLTDRGWPSDGPSQFMLALLVGASTALVICHVAPALCAPAISRLAEDPAGRIIGWPVAAWFCVGAATSLAHMARISGSMYVLLRDVRHEPTWKLIAILVALFCALVSMGIAWLRTLRQRLVIGFCLVLGIGLAITTCWVQVPGLATRNPQMTSEEGLNYPLRMIEGMLLAAAPGTILALRIGRMGLATRRVWWTGVIGVWLPLVTSVALLSLSKMCGARLYWKPSFPIGFEYAFAWLFQRTDSLARGLWPLSLTMLSPSIVCAIWIKDLTRTWPWNLRKLLAFAGLAATACWLMSPFLSTVYYSYWLWSILFASLLASVVWVVSYAASRIFARHAR
jgi:hypothetical protein